MTGRYSEFDKNNWVMSSILTISCLCDLSHAVTQTHIYWKVPLMVRPLRITYPGTVYLCDSLGEWRQSGVQEQEWLVKISGIFGIRHGKIPCGCSDNLFNDNHYHLMLETPCENLPQTIIMSRMKTWPYSFYYFPYGGYIQLCFESLVADILTDDTNW